MKQIREAYHYAVILVWQALAAYEIIVIKLESSHQAVQT